MDHEPYIPGTAGNLSDTAGGTHGNHYGGAGQCNQSPRGFNSRTESK
ncbi:hypothetical protein A2U01_0113472, partial [Trifolium medium]|nr:hypothetical protein [Trifolium medium]